MNPQCMSYLSYVCRLAGIEEYPSSEVAAQEPWITMPVTQLEDALQQLQT